MKYHIYRYGNGCEWKDNLQEAADYFNQLPTDGKYTTIGITEGSYAVDVVIKGQYAKGQDFLLSQDIRQSRLFNENPDKMIKALSDLYDAVGVKSDFSKNMLEDLKDLANESDYDLDEI
ncbi:hypothetical protein F8154_04280 [Alkaliphilus pronyensis]|uniref:Uncharacterized protein n=1 Tax=Alkaliphilus pronyensis TaxID=1482732 RepID=A0A6I0FJL8_9FIRM|nr:hypothetical protein [Alkaliphilus pronyensis]KAB3536301.1 hypothetical protein F8154_04280 [Alkaliphilus pronyensis]